MSIVHCSFNSVRLFLTVDGILDGLVDDEEVEGGRPVLEVPDVQLDAALHLPEFAGLAPEAVDLGPAGDAGLDEVAHHVLVDEVGVLVGVLQHVGARTHDGHVAPEDVDELGQLVDAGLADELAHTRLARVVERGLQAVAVRIDPHGAELVAPEVVAVEPRAPLPEEDGAGRRELDGDADNDVDEGEQRAEEQARENDVEQTLGEAVLHPVERLVADGEDGRVAHQQHVHAAFQVIADAGDAVEMDEMVFTIVDDGQDVVRMGGREAAEDHLDTVGLHPGNDVVQTAQVGDGVGVGTGRLHGEIALDTETVGRVDGNLVVEVEDVFVAAQQHHGARVASLAAVPLEQGPEDEAVGGKADKKGCIERQEKTEGDGPEIGQREERDEHAGVEHDVARGLADDVVGAHDAPIEDDPVGIVADEVNQIEHDQNLGNRVHESPSQCGFTEDVVEEQEQEVHDDQISQNDDALQKLIEL